MVSNLKVITETILFQITVFRKNNRRNATFGHKTAAKGNLGTKIISDVVSVRFFEVHRKIVLIVE